MRRSRSNSELVTGSGHSTVATFPGPSPNPRLRPLAQKELVPDTPPPNPEPSSVNSLRPQSKGKSRPPWLRWLPVCMGVCKRRGGGSGSRAGNVSLGFPGWLFLKKNPRVGAMHSPPRSRQGRGWGEVWLWHLTGPPHPKTEANSPQQQLIGQSRPLKAAHSPRITPATPGPTLSSRRRGSRRPPPPPQGRGTHTPGVRETEGRGREGGVTSGRNSSPRSGTFSGRGGRERGGEWGGREEALTLRAPPRTGPPPARDPWPPPYAWACVGTCAGAPRGGRPPRSAPGGGGCAGTDLASGFLVSAAGRRSRGERLRTRCPSGASSRAGLATAPPPASLRPPSAQGRVTSFPSPTGRRKPLWLSQDKALKSPRLSLGWEKWRFLGIYPTSTAAFGLLGGPHRVPYAPSGGKKKKSWGLRKGVNLSPLSTARHPLNQRQVRAVIYVFQSDDGARSFKKPKTFQPGGWIREVQPRDIFRRQVFQARGAGEPKRAATGVGSRSSRLRSASLAAPLGDTTSLEDQAQKRVCAGYKPVYPDSRNLVVG